jgi:hypothetical protein
MHQQEADAHHEQQEEPLGDDPREPAALAGAPCRMVSCHTFAVVGSAAACAAAACLGEILERMRHGVDARRSSSSSALQSAPIAQVARHRLDSASGISVVPSAATDSVGRRQLEAVDSSASRRSARLQRGECLLVAPLRALESPVERGDRFLDVPLAPGRASAPPRPGAS